MDERQLEHMMAHAGEKMNMDLIAAIAINAKISPQKLINTLTDRKAIDKFMEGMAVAMVSGVTKMLESELKRINKKK